MEQKKRITLILTETHSCKVCDAGLPPGRDDDICEECRRRRIVDRRDMRPKVYLNKQPAVFQAQQ